MTRPPRRPLFHFAPDRGWLNDPNGLVRHDGRWHAFYQKSEVPPDHRVIGWGHAVSDDLIGWTDCGMAIPPDAHGYAYSGCVVPSADGLTAFLTRHDPATGRQVQEVARSADGRDWAVVAPRPLLDEGLTAFRDPFLVRMEDGSWRMILVKPIDWHDWRAGRSRFTLYRSGDLAAWEPLGAFGPEGREGELYEVPLLLRLSIEGEPGAWRWLLVSSIVDRAGDAVACRTVAWIGQFDGEAFAVERGPVPLDHGPDFYAATSFAGLPDGETVLMAWLNSWAYARRTPGDAPIGGTLTIPRRLALRRDADGAVALAQFPAVDLAVIARRRVPIALALGAETVALPFEAAAFALTLDIAFGAAERVVLSLRHGAACRTVLTLDAAGRVTLDRTASGAVEIDPAFPGAWTAPLPITNGRVGVTVLVDRCSVELFAVDGATTLTASIFPDADGVGLTLSADGTAEVTGTALLLDEAQGAVNTTGAWAVAST